VNDKTAAPHFFDGAILIGLPFFQVPPGDSGTLCYGIRWCRSSSRTCAPPTRSITFLIALQPPQPRVVVGHRVPFSEQPLRGKLIIVTRWSVSSGCQGENVFCALIFCGISYDSTTSLHRDLACELPDRFIFLWLCRSDRHSPLSSAMAQCAILVILDTPPCSTSARVPHPPH